MWPRLASGSVGASSPPPQARSRPTRQADWLAHSRRSASARPSSSLYSAPVANGSSGMPYGQGAGAGAGTGTGAAVAGVAKYIGSAMEQLPGKMADDLAGPLGVAAREGAQRVIVHLDALHRDLQSQRHTL